MLLTKRLEVKLDNERYLLLKKTAKETHSSIAELIRNAIDKIYSIKHKNSRIEAVKKLSKVNSLTPEPEDMLTEINGGRML